MPGLDPLRRHVHQKVRLVRQSVPNDLYDAPWVFAYVAVIWVFHPALGIASAIAGIVMLTMAWLNDRISRNAGEP